MIIAFHYIQASAVRGFGNVWVEGVAQIKRSTLRAENEVTCDPYVRIDV
jgi:hypothetical protein